jgi:acetyl-CoA acetyltransferase
VLEHGLDAIGIRGVLNAAAAIQAGLCETVLVGAAVATGLTIPAGVPDGAASPRGASPAIAGLEFVDPFGADLTGRLALTARRHMHDYGTTSEQLAEVAVAIRNHGHENPEAMMFGRGPYSVADVIASPMIADPLHRLDLALTGEGACALVMTGAARARRLTATPVSVLSGAMSFSDGPHWSPSLLRDEGMLGRARPMRAYEDAGIGPDDVDLLSVYDATSFEVIRTLEMLGFCEEGEGGPFVEGGALARGGRLPTNTDGGLLAHGFAVTAQLLMKVVEAVRQLRGACGPRQVAGAELAVCTNGVASAHHVEALVLGRR